MNIRLKVKLGKNEHNIRNYRSQIILSNPKFHDYELPSYVYFYDCEINIGDKEETFAYKLLKGCQGTLKVSCLHNTRSNFKNTNKKNLNNNVSPGSFELPEKGLKYSSFCINLGLNDYSNFLVSLNAAESLAVDFSFYEEEDAKIEELARLILEDNINRAKLITLGNPIDAGRTTIYLR